MPSTTSCDGLFPWLWRKEWEAGAIGFMLYLFTHFISFIVSLSNNLLQAKVWRRASPFPLDIQHMCDKSLRDFLKRFIGANSHSVACWLETFHWEWKPTSSSEFMELFRSVYWTRVWDSLAGQRFSKSKWVESFEKKMKKRAKKWNSLGRFSWGNRMSEKQIRLYINSWIQLEQKI